MRAGPAACARRRRRRADDGRARRGRAAAHRAAAGRPPRQRPRARRGGVRPDRSLDRARPVRPDVAAAPRSRAAGDEPAPTTVEADAADRRRLRGPAVGRRCPWRFVERGHRSVSGPARALTGAGRPWTSARSPCSSSRPSGRGSPRPPRSRRRAGWPRRSSRPTTRSSSPAALDETDQARALLEERPGIGIGAARDIGPAIERAARGGRLEPAQFLEIAETLDATARLATSLADERRPLLRDLGRELHALPAAALDARPQLRPGRRAARHGLAPARWPAGGRPGRLRPPAAAARRARRRGARQRAPGADRHAPQRALRGAGQGRGAVAGQGHRPRRVGQRPDPVHRAARGGRARQRLARGAGRRGRGDRAHPRRAVGVRGRQRGGPARDARGARPVRPVGRQGVAGGRHGRDAGGDRRSSPRSSCCRPAIPG